MQWAAASCRKGRLHRRLILSSTLIRCVFLWLISQPPRRSSVWIRLQPQRTRTLDLPDVLPLRAIGPPMRLTRIAGAIQTQRANRPAATDTISLVKQAASLHKQSLRYSTICTTSWSISLYKFRPATWRFRWAFSSSNCFNHRSSLTSNPPYLRFQLQ